MVCKTEKGKRRKIISGDGRTLSIAKTLPKKIDKDIKKAKKNLGL